MHPSIIRTLSTGNMRGSFTITTIGRSIGIFDRGCWPEKRQTHPGFKELIEVKGEVSRPPGDHGAHGPVLIAACVRRASINEFGVLLIQREEYFYGKQREITQNA
jgi:hypothetical protein